MNKEICITSKYDLCLAHQPMALGTAVHVHVLFLSALPWKTKWKCWETKVEWSWWVNIHLHCPCLDNSGIWQILGVYWCDSASAAWWQTAPWKQTLLTSFLFPASLLIPLSMLPGYRLNEHLHLEFALWWTKIGYYNICLQKLMWGTDQGMQSMPQSY